MQATGTLKAKIVIRKLENSGSAYQFMLLCGFTPALSHKNADYVESLSSNAYSMQIEIKEHIAKFIKMSNAADHLFITNKSVLMKLNKLFNTDDEHDAEGAKFGEMKIGEYLPA